MFSTYSDTDEASYQLLNPDDVAGYLEDTGVFASFYEHYEERPPQLALTRAIVNCFNTCCIGVFEAGTGVGKSFAYLLPALEWARKNQVRIVISTGTINLQHQLIEKDIPTAMKILDGTDAVLPVVLIKGRQNYVCIRRLMKTLQEPDLFQQDIQDLEAIRTWAAQASEGSKSELPFMPSAALWSKVCSESDNCLGQRCAFFSSCFVMKLKKRAEKAALLVVNHHLLFADLASRKEGAGYEGTAVLPPFKAIIFDEAHTIEESARLFFSHTFSQYEISRSITSLYRTKRGSHATGCLEKIAQIANQGELKTVIIHALAKCQAAFSVLEAAALQFCGKAGSLSFTQAPAAQVHALLPALETFYRELSVVTGKLDLLLTGIEPDQDSLYEDAIRDCSLVSARLKSITETIEHFFQWDKIQDHVFWIEKVHTANGDIPRFNQTPIEMAPLLRQSVFRPFDTVIAASATLKIGTSFTYWLNQIGLQHFTEKRIITDSFESPFPYEHNVLLNIPSDAPLPDSESFQSFINKAIVKLIEMTGGRTLVLFTSYDSLKHAAAYAREHLSDLAILQQGEADRAKLLHQFKEEVSSSLFATASFWVGVDVRGEALTHVILVKLPFAVPADPIFRARADAIEQAGGSSFMQLSVPEAVIQFRQGFGRLMRSQTDRGIVTLLDKRALVKQYGSIFIESIPQTKRCFAPLEEIVYTIEKFLY